MSGIHLYSIQYLATNKLGYNLRYFGKFLLIFLECKGGNIPPQIRPRKNPGIHLYSIQYLIHQFQPAVFLFHLFFLIFSYLHGDKTIQWQEYYHHTQTSKHCNTNLEIKWAGSNVFGLVNVLKFAHFLFSFFSGLDCRTAAHIHISQIN